jgi:hypothetical protein
MNFFSNIFGHGIKDTNQHGEFDEFDEINKYANETAIIYDLAMQAIYLHGKELSISGVISLQNPGFIKYNSFRPVDPTLQKVEFLMSINEFFTDLRKFFRYISVEQSIDNQTFQNSYLKVIQEHIEKFNRIIDTDLYSYIDLAIGAKEILWLKFYNQTPIIEENSALWVLLKDISFSKFRDFIYISKLELKDPLHPTVNLLKLSDLIQE